ncbi:MAG: hypothetical protein V1758_16705 [Pseudomonadota bacterium]
MVSIFFLRLILSVFLAFFMGRFFFQGGFVVKSLGLAAVMLALAYLFEYTKKRDKGERDGT